MSNPKQKPDKVMVDDQKHANKVGKAISKAIGEDKQFILIVTDDVRVFTLTNVNDKIKTLGLMEYAKNDFNNK
jgi:hypothetical protein